MAVKEIFRVRSRKREELNRSFLSWGPYTAQTVDENDSLESNYENINLWGGDHRALKKKVKDEKRNIELC